LEKQINADIVRVLQRINPALIADKTSSFRLGQIPDFTGRASTSQRFGLPIQAVGNIYQNQAAKEAFSPIAEKIIQRTARNEDA
jgi:hypothetical protein